MSLTLLTQNRLEDTTSTVTVSVAAATGKPVTRVYDRRKSLQYEGSAAVQTDIDVDLGSSLACSAWAFLNHNISGFTLELFAEDASPPTVSQDSLDPAAADFLRTFTEATKRYWRARLPDLGATVPLVGEFFLGVHKTLPNPSYGQGELYRGLVERDETRAGYVWKARLGTVRTELALHWNVMTDANWTILKAAFDQAYQSAKPFPMIDHDSNLWFVEFKENSLRRRRLFTGLNEVEATFLQVLS